MDAPFLVVDPLPVLIIKVVLFVVVGTLTVTGTEPVVEPAEVAVREQAQQPQPELVEEAVDKVAAGVPRMGRHQLDEEAVAVRCDDFWCSV